MGSTSSAKGRYRLTGIDEPRWGFHAGWPDPGGPAGLTMLRVELNASELEVTVIAPGISEGTSDRRIANTRDGKPVWIRPRRGVRGGAPAARPALYRFWRRGKNAAGTVANPRAGPAGIAT
ncbi:hypothetical protein MTIM_50700 [Mycobacterium timonense]|uniref:Uncharacterized protein n=1 Tax=Mycobacterium timonense TaxID=701043 RepID=A0A7I9ZDY7_9MYCO|nr:hypothetical protein MTIM_50700 [Mycobacterium timonense]